MVMIGEYFYRKTYPGFTEWTLSALSMGIGQCLFCFRYYIPDVFSIVLANTFIVVFNLLLARGLSRFFSLKIHDWLNAGALVIFVLLFNHYTYFDPNLKVRIVVISLYALVYSFYCSWLLFHGGKECAYGRDRLLFWTFIVLSVWGGIRIFLTFHEDTSIQDFMIAGNLHKITYLIFIACNILILTGLIRLSSNRLNYDLQEAKKEIITLSGLFTHLCQLQKNTR